MSEFEKLGTDPEVWAKAFAQKFAMTNPHGFVDTRAVASAWFHYLAYAVRQEVEAEDRVAFEALRKAAVEVIEDVGR